MKVILSIVLIVSIIVLIDAKSTPAEEKAAAQKAQNIAQGVKNEEQKIENQYKKEEQKLKGEIVKEKQRLNDFETRLKVDELTAKDLGHMIKQNAEQKVKNGLNKAASKL